MKAHGKCTELKIRKNRIKNISKSFILCQLIFLPNKDIIFLLLFYEPAFLNAENTTQFESRSAITISRIT